MRLRNIGIGAVVLLGGALLIVPAISQAGDEPARPKLATGTPGRVAMVPGKKGFTFQNADGDRERPYAFVSSGGQVRARALTDGDQRAATNGGDQRAAKAGVTARTAAAAATTYPTTLTIASENNGAWSPYMALWNVDGWNQVPVTLPLDSRTGKANLPAGNYYAAVMYGVSGVNSYLLTRTFTVGSKAQTVTLDEKSAKEVAFKVDDTTAHTDATAIWMSLPDNQTAGIAGGGVERVYASVAAASGTTLRVHQLLTKAGSSAQKPSPYRYDLVRYWPSPVTAATVVGIRTANLARTTTTVRAQGVTTDGSFGSIPVLSESGSFLSTPTRFPATFTEYVTPGVNRSRVVNYGNSQQFTLADRSMPAGANPAQTAGAAPLAPTRRPWNDDSRRADDQLQITENMTLGDAAGNRGSDFDTAYTSRLSAGSEELAKSDSFSLIADVPTYQQTYRLEQTATRRNAWSQLSTSVRSDWTFRSSRGNALLPLMDVNLVASGLDDRNRAGSGPVTLTVKPSTRIQPDAVAEVGKVEWSADDGRNWTVAELDGTAATIEVPAGTAYISLRVSVSNDQGGALRRTVLRAFAGPATGGDEQSGGTTTGGPVVNAGKPIVVSTSGYLSATATFTASDPSGVASAGLALWHGGWNTPDGVIQPRTECTPAGGTAVTCTAYLFLGDVRWSLAGNALAGTWNVRVWATAKDGSVVDRHQAGTASLKRQVRLTTDATPEPVKAGRTVTIAGPLTVADWGTGTFKPLAGPAVQVQWIQRGTTTWKVLTTAKSDAAGKVTATRAATLDGSYRLVFPGDAANNIAVSGADYVDVQ